MEQVKVSELFDLSQTRAKEMLEMCTYPWEALPKIHDLVLQIGPTLPNDLYEKKGENIWIAKSSIVAPTVSITGPCIIGEETEVRQCAFIRGNVLVGDHCVVGNSVELKNVILFNYVQTPHYNYVGDSVLGYRSHMGAGSITSNVKSDKTLVDVHTEAGSIETGLKKFGAILGDFVEVGCNSVLNPGTVIGSHSQIYPVSCVRGVVPSDSIYKSKDQIVEKK